MKEVRFIRPDNTIINLKYWEVMAYCQSICLSKDHIASFQKFAKSYQFFSACFDYLIFKLHFIFNIDDRFIAAHSTYNGIALYQIQGELMSYSKLEAAIHEKYESDDYMIPWMTSCADEELRIHQNSHPELLHDSLIDGNLFSFMCTTGIPNGLHDVTAKTILNEFLISSKLVWQDYRDFLEKYEFFTPELDYLIARFGFIRVARDYVILNQGAINEKQQEFVNDLKKSGKTVVPFKKSLDSLMDNSVYRKLILKR